MAITLADFNKIWASSSPLTPYSFSNDNYNEGWNFIGQIPPSRQMWDFLQKNNDEKMQYLANNYLPLSGGTMTGAITLSNGKGVLRSFSSGTFLYAEESTQNTRLELRTNANGEGFRLVAGNGTQGVAFIGNPNGTLTWGGNNVITSAGGTLTGNVNINKSEFWLSNIHANDDGMIRFRTNDTSWKNGASLALTAMNHSDGGKFFLQAGDGTNTPTLEGRPDGTLTWDGKSIPQRAYGIQLEGSGDGSTYTFNINKNGAIIFAKRGANSSCHMVDMWSADSVAMFSSGTDPITITKSSDSNEVTITNTNNSAVAIKIINGDGL